MNEVIGWFFLCFLTEFNIYLRKNKYKSLGNSVVNYSFNII
uniref:Uncharacterized protein n=1 Tax=Heterorhabditis bacteriophora TaxID=37862 RepID=A0A1I7WDG3_HETBA